MPRNLLDPKSISRLANLQLRARAVVEGFLTGLHQSPYHGFSVEFSQHRPYTPGDALKHLDHKVLAKTGRYYIKQFQEETNLKAYLLVDHSGSMGFGGDPAEKTRKKSRPHSLIESGPLPSPDVRVEGTKLDYATSLAAALALLLLRQRDAVGLISFAEKVTHFMSPSAALGWLDPLTSQLQELKPSGETQVSAALLDVAERIKRRGMVVLLSDLLGDPDPTLAAMKALRHVGHDMIVFHILDPLELSFAFPRDARFKDLETGEVIPSRPWHIRESYRQAVAAFVAQFRLRCREQNIDYHLFTTDTPYEIALFEFLARRKRLM